ncbi:uncharacterized protein METZ01_LOCUS338941, partial [marine metagenome]
VNFPQLEKPLFQGLKVQKISVTKSGPITFFTAQTTKAIIGNNGFTPTAVENIFW